MEALRNREKDVSDELRNAEYGKKPKSIVENWLKDVSDKKTEVQDVEQKAEKRRNLSRLPFLRLLDKNIEELIELIEQGRFPEGLLIDVHDKKGEALLTSPLVGQTTAERNLEKIWKCFINDEIICIGVYGMGGVGKTTIATHIHNRLLESPSSADHVYWVTVSQESSIHKLQNDIAKYIRLDLSKEDDERKRATRLFNALGGRKKFVLILDDMWKVFPPKEIGIPIGVNSGKLLITTRSLEVCRGMKCQQNIKVEPLSTEEAWDLFTKNVGTEKVLDQKIKEIAMSIAKECSGLPLAIVTTARSMTGVDDIHDWRNALDELREGVEGFADMEDKVFKKLKFSYDRLKDEKLQQCFLYCALFPEDYKIPKMDLILYWIAEGLLDGRRTRRAKFDRGHFILNKLENVCLLESAKDCYGSIYVKMHDVIRDMALNITKKENGGPIFMMTSGRLLQIPNEIEWSENLERVCLEEDIIEEHLSTSISRKCPRLLTLLLQNYRNIEQIPNSFFVHMQSLRVLDLSYLGNLKRLPDSISNLKSLRGLFLNQCHYLEYVPSLAELKELRELYLHRSGVTEVPKGLQGLVNLKCLSLFRALGIQSIPTGLLRSLSQLQCLRLDDCFNVDVETEELISLRQLEMLGVNFSNLHGFNNYVNTQHWQRLSHYCLQIKSGHGHDLLPCRRVSISELGRAIMLNCSIVLPSNMQELNIENCVLPTSLLDFSPSLGKNACRDLERCHIGGSEGIEHLWSFTSTTTSVPINLQTLRLTNLPDLISLFKYEGVEREGGPPAPIPETGFFSRLKLLSVWSCEKVKYLFTARLVRHHMQNLELIRVFRCSQMENIIVDEEEEEEGITTERISVLTFSKLRSLKLQDVLQLKSICTGTNTMVCPSLQKIKVDNCPKLRRLSLSTINVDDNRRESEAHPGCLIKISGQKKWWDLLEWDNPQAKSVLQPLFSVIEPPTFPLYRTEGGTWFKDLACYEEVK
ncbi:hypothetical protein F0562_030651 [Nyssa sinensis]|uniref:Uncharacterized protein n=1 Tax=Nyssa sinensis TaxID=561372 RepID=A0A5J5AZE6_9ASTE|nr:hypothetical protein F0562_030651 [Nyssa sinensis]